MSDGMERNAVNLKTMAKKKEFWDNYLFVAIVLGVVLLTLCFFRRTVVNGHSMDSTFFHGQNLVCARTEYNNNVTIDNGDIVVVDSEVFNTLIVKRVIGTPGDTIQIKDNVLYLNGVALEENYINEPMETEDIPAFVLGEGEYFVMGDNRNKSADSRRIGPIKESEMYGKVVFDIQHMTGIEIPEVFSEFRD